MKTQVKKILALTLMLSLLAGVLSLTACKVKPENVPTDAVEETAQAEQNETALNNNETEASAENEDALYDASAAIPIGTGTALTDEELDDITEKLPCISRETDPKAIGNLYRISPCSRFLSSYYEDVKDLDFYLFMRYMPVMRDEHDERIKISDDELVDIVGSSDGAYVLNKYLVSDVEQVLQSYAGIGLEDLHEDYRNTERLTFSEKYGALYTSTSDSEEVVFAVSAAERIGEKIYLYGYCAYDGGVSNMQEILILTQTSDGGYWFVSHLPANW